MKSGHSLVELMVSLVLLGTGLGAVGATAALGARWTARGAARQEALARTEEVLDSLLALVAEPTAGAEQRGALTLTWAVVPVDAGVARVRVRADGPGGVVSLEAPRVPFPPPLPPQP